MELFGIYTNEADKLISLVSNTEQTLTVLNILEYNTDQNGLQYNSETGEITVIRNAILEYSGLINLYNDEGETPVTMIDLVRNGTPEVRLANSILYSKTFSTGIISVIQGDIITLEIKSPETIDLKTMNIKSFFNLKRLFK